MIPSTDPRTSATPQLAPHAQPTQTQRWPGEHLPRVDHLAQLSAMTDYLRVLQQHYGADSRVHGRARHAAARVQALAHALSAATPVDPARCPTPAATGPCAEVPQEQLETAFQRWLAEPLEADEIRLDDPERPPPRTATPSRHGSLLTPSGSPTPVTVNSGSSSSSSTPRTEDPSCWSGPRNDSPAPRSLTHTSVRRPDGSSSGPAHCTPPTCASPHPGGPVGPCRGPDTPAGADADRDGWFGPTRTLISWQAAGPATMRAGDIDGG